MGSNRLGKNKTKILGKTETWWSQWSRETQYLSIYTEFGEGSNEQTANCFFRQFLRLRLFGQQEVESIWRTVTGQRKMKHENERRRRRRGGKS